MPIEQLAKHFNTKTLENRRKYNDVLQLNKLLNYQIYQIIKIVLNYRLKYV
jgi:hypothetical protein